MKRLIEIFEEPNGGFSSTRVVFVLWFTLLTLNFTAMSIASLVADPKNPKFPAIPETVIIMSGSLLGQKWLQRREEVKKEETENV